MPIDPRNRPVFALAALALTASLASCGDSQPVSQPPVLNSSGSATVSPGEAPGSPSVEPDGATTGPDSATTPKSVAETWLHAVGSGDVAAACAQYNPEGQLFRALGGEIGCEQNMAESAEKEKDYRSRLTRAVVDLGQFVNRGEATVIPMAAVTIDGAKWTNGRIDGDFMTLIRVDGRWRIRDYTDAVLVNPPAG